LAINVFDLIGNTIMMSKRKHFLYDSMVGGLRNVYRRQATVQREKPGTKDGSVTVIDIQKVLTTVNSGSVQVSSEHLIASILVPLMAIKAWSAADMRLYFSNPCCGKTAPPNIENNQ